jgi:hypothetical protein
MRILQNLSCLTNVMAHKSGEPLVVRDAGLTRKRVVAQTRRPFPPRISFAFCPAAWRGEQEIFQVRPARKTKRLAKLTYALRLMHSKSFAKAFEFAGEAATESSARTAADGSSSSVRKETVRRSST